MKAKTSIAVSQHSLPWPQINSFLLDIGKERAPWDFCKKVCNNISGLIPFDTAMLYLLGEDLKPFDQVLIGVDAEWSQIYLNYYSRLENHRFSYLVPTPNFIEWKDVENCEYLRDFIRPQKVHHTAALKFFNAEGWLTGALCINRKGNSGFTLIEKELVNLIRAHINNLHANFFVRPAPPPQQFNFFNAEGTLTRRESQIVDLLCKGMNPQLISRRLFISYATVNRHIANIHKKLKISTRQELLVKILGNETS